MPRGSGYKQPGNWKSLRKKILERDGYTCHCGREAISVDHLVPVARGGSHHPSNLAAICGPCKTAKDEADRRAGYANRKPRTPTRRPPEPHPGISPNA